MRRGPMDKRWFTSRFYPVSALIFCFVKNLIRGLQDHLRITQPLAGFRSTDADSDFGRFSTGWRPPSSVLGLTFPSSFGPNIELLFFYDFSICFQMGQRLPKALSWKDGSEFLPPISIDLSPPAQFFQLSSNHLEDLVTRLVTVFVIEFFKMVNVNHGDRISSTQV